MQKSTPNDYYINPILKIQTHDLLLSKNIHLAFLIEKIYVKMIKTSCFMINTAENRNEDQSKPMKSSNKKEKI